MTVHGRGQTEQLCSQVSGPHDQAVVTGDIDAEILGQLNDKGCIGAGWVVQAQFLGQNGNPVVIRQNKPGGGSTVKAVSCFCGLQCLGSADILVDRLGETGSSV